MESEVSHNIEDEEQFWGELNEIVSAPCETSELIDNILRLFVGFATTYKRMISRDGRTTVEADGEKEQYLRSEHDIARCCNILLHSHVYQSNQDYVRRQLLYCLLQEDNAETLHLAAAVLLFDGRANESAFEMMQTEGAFPRLIGLIKDKVDDVAGLHRMLLELLFEMSRIQKLSREDLMTVDDALILYLFQLIEQLSDDSDDPYHYPIIRVLLVLNEQYMCLATDPMSPNTDSIGHGAITNRVLKLLSSHGPSYRTFGENLILLLNREAALSAQLLILKLLYLLFTTPPTYEYFYTNDLHVLVDVIIRNLLDLDPGSHLSAPGNNVERSGQRVLRHTYLRVLCPLLKNTQLGREGNSYKREEVRKLLYVLVNRSSAHFAPVDETVIRLVIRCKQVEWLKEPGDEQDHELERKLSDLAPKDYDVAKQLLGMSLNDAGVSGLSVVDVAAKVTKEKPNVPAPRRRRWKKSKGTDQQPNGVHLEVPPTNVSVAISGPEERGRSPFADDSEQV